jgi:tellurite resistance protein TerC
MSPLLPFAALSSGAGPWLALIGAIAVLLALDLLVVRGRGGEMSVRFAALASAVWVGIALAFGAVLFLAGEPGAAGDYLAGYLVEKSLSLDNVFVFLLVFTAFGVAEAERHKLLTYGIIGALVMRAVFIVVGAAALHSFSWVAYIFAAFLLYTGVKLLRHRHDHDGETALVEKIQKRLPLRAGGAALAAIAIVDIIFAVDSVPAILAITNVTFVVFAANAFALLGLRPLFFLVAELVERLYYLKTALAVLLIFIGVKMALGEAVGKIGPEYSLPGIALILGTGVVASLIRDRRAAPEPSAAG